MFREGKLNIVRGMEGNERRIVTTVYMEQGRERKGKEEKKYVFSNSIVQWNTCMVSFIYVSHFLCSFIISVTELYLIYFLFPGYIVLNYKSMQF